MSDALVVALLGAIASGFGGAGFWAWLQSRRTTSGQVITTPAEILWQQMQQLLTSTQERADKAEAQRDKLIEQRDKLLEGYTETSATLASINVSLRRLLELAQIQDRL